MRVFKNVRKIAILRANALGDFIFSLPAITALKNKYQQAEIVLLGREWHKDFIETHQVGIDRVEVVPPYPGVSEVENYSPDKRTLDRFFARMRREKFDLAFQLHGGGRNSNPFVLSLNARLSFGLQTADAKPLDFNVPYIYFQHEVMRYLEVAGLAGAKAYQILPSLRPTDNDIEAARMALPVGVGERFVVLHPGATDMRRRWPVEKFAEAGNRLISQGFEVVITGNDEEAKLTAQLASLMKGRAIDLTGKLTLSGLVGILSVAELLISNDTGPLHLGMALGTPTVGIYWCGNMINASPLYRRINRPLISWQIECALCGRNIIHDTRDKCQHEMSFVSEVKVQDVLQNAFDLLSQPEKVRSRWLNS